MLKADCLYFKGDKPCAYKRLCDGCPHFLPFPKKILIIKCRAQGDVLRTTALLTGIQRKHPASHITWLVDEESVELLNNNPYTDRVLGYNIACILPLMIEQFDVLISLDKEPPSTSLATLVKSANKFGFGMNEYGNLIPFNTEAEYAYQLGVDDDLKFSQNTMTYQEIIYKTAEIEYQGDGYIFQLEEECREKASRFFQEKAIDKTRTAIGLNTGAGVKFETKQWSPEKYVQLIDHMSESLQVNIFLLGGKRETELNHYLENRSESRVFNTGNDNSLLEFAGFLSMMDIVVSSDTLGMHLALAQGKKVVALFGPTCPQEIDLFGLGTKLFAGVDCAPCYKQTCPDMKCMDEITPEHVFDEIKKLI
ncbi:glycosyltransferase family 9 protein [Acidobacteriota bacterium]